MHSVRRRHLLAGLGSAAALGLAGCSGGDSGDGGDDSDEEEIGSGGADDGSDGTSGADTDGEEGASGNGEMDGGIGVELQGDLAKFAVEYVEPVDTVIEYRSLPHTEYDDPYRNPMSAQDYIDQGFAPEGSELYAVGIAVANTHDDLLDVSTLLATGDDGPARGSLPGRSQELSLFPVSRDSSRYAAPGELQRGEITFALPEDVSAYTLTFEPFGVGSTDRERFTVDLGTGSDATASFSQNPPTESVTETVSVGDFDVTIRSIDRVRAIDGADSEHAFGPHEDYDYLEIVCDVSRESAAMGNTQHWTFGMTDDEGHAFWWHTVYDDAMDFNRQLLERMEVGDEARDYVLGFPVEKAFDPTYVTMESIGPFEDDSDRRGGRMYRKLWALR